MYLIDKRKKCIHKIDIPDPVLCKELHCIGTKTITLSQIHFSTSIT